MILLVPYSYPKQVISDNFWKHHLDWRTSVKPDKWSMRLLHFDSALLIIQPIQPV